MSDNLKIWNHLRRTDPAHTKKFRRQGGFSGTAIKPIYSTLRMTETFGPCGIGWGMDRPEFTTMQAGGDIVVYCTVGLWFLDGEARGQVYGVGGDKVAAKRQSGDVFADDEAFKKAFTDALSNAMKQLGVGGDVHMGQHDDDKYVRELRQEIAAEHNGAPKPAPAAPATRRPPVEPPVNPETGEVSPHAVRVQPSDSGDGSDWITWGASIAAAVNSAETLAEVDAWAKANVVAMGNCERQAPKVHARLCAVYDKRRAELAPPEEGEDLARNLMAG